jgi:alkanesulfonate monooxygenase SsuD/methylene tetrahydromethanopterin reductase-like flavin-dependent oxidoreductase (luciferase family)
MFSLRFDMRAPASGGPAPELYRAALEMAQWADENGALAITLCEHHASPDGYLPAPLVMAAAIAARTTRVPIRVAALIAPLHNPVQLAEEIAVLDLVSGGRVSYVFGLGYRREESELYGLAHETRAQRLDDTVRMVRAAFAGGSLPGRDPALRATPVPATPGGPAITLGGGTVAAVRRAARLGLGMITETPGLKDAYLSACEEFGVAPGAFHEAPRDPVTVAFIAPDLDAAWQQIGPHLLHDASMYAGWNKQAGKSQETVSTATTADEMRQAGRPYAIFTPEQAAEYVATRGPLSLSPLCGGTPPEIGWSTLRLLADEVLPRLSGS